MKIELPQENQIFQPGQCIPIKVVDLPKVENGMISVGIYPFPVIFGFFNVVDGVVDVKCLTAFPYNYSLLSISGSSQVKYTPKEEMIVEINGEGSLFGQVAGIQPIRFIETKPLQVYLKVNAIKDTTIKVYGWNSNLQFGILGVKKISAGKTGYVNILEGNIFSVSGGRTYNVVYTDNPKDPYIGVNPFTLVKKIVESDYTIEVVTTKPETNRPYYIVNFYNKSSYSLVVFYHDYYFGYTDAEISPGGMSIMFVDRENSTLYPSISQNMIVIPCNPIIVSENEDIYFTEEEAKQCIYL